MWWGLQHCKAPIFSTTLTLTDAIDPYYLNWVGRHCWRFSSGPANAGGLQSWHTQQSPRPRMLRPSPPESSALGRLLQLPPMLGWLLRRHCAHWGVGYSGSLLHKAVSRPLGPMRSCRRPCRGSRSFDPCRIPQVVPAFQGWDALQVPRHPLQRPGATGASHPTQPEQSSLQVACTSAPPNACKALGVLRSWGSEAQHAGYPHPHQCHWLGIRPLGLHPWPLEFFGPQLKDQLETPKAHCPTASNLLPASLHPSL